MDVRKDHFNRCDQWIDTSSLAKLGDYPICDWKSSRIVHIDLRHSVGATIVNEKIYLIGSELYTDLESC